MRLLWKRAAIVRLFKYNYRKVAGLYNLTNSSNGMKECLAIHDRNGERYIAFAQATIASVVLVLHVIANIKAGWQHTNVWVYLILSALILTAFIRWQLSKSDILPERKLDLLSVVDISIFLCLIWSYQFAYQHPAGGVLKASSILLLIAFVAVRALRFHPRPILVAGLTAISGWIVLVVGSIAADGSSAITTSYQSYLSSFHILVGAETEKLLGLIFLTSFLAIASHKARVILSRAAHADDYSEALNVAKDNLGKAKSAKKAADTALKILQINQSKLAESNDQLDKVLSNMSQGFCLFDKNQNLVFCNQQYQKMYEMPDDLVVPGATLAQIMEYRVENGLYAGDDKQAYIKQRLDCVKDQQYSRMIHELPKGRIYAVEHQPLPDGGWLTTHDDITEIRKVESRIAHMALHDDLTGLPNRALFRDRIEAALPRTNRGDSFAVIIIDIDHFKDINDSLGHPAGDELLKRLAKRMQGCVREIDTIARLGGDEFAIIQVSANQPQDVTALTRRIYEAVKEPFDIDGHQLSVNVSMGISIAPDDGHEADKLLKNADMALYKAKADGRGVFHFFEEEMDTRMQARRQTETELRSAITNDEFELFYQPLFESQSSEICGLEALLRWRHPERGLVPPGDFIPLAEDIGLIIPMGNWVITQACRDAATWPNHIKVAVNVSAVQFRNDSLVPTVIQALSSSKLRPNRLELEITETAMLKDSDRTLEILHQLKGIGVRIVMDDFGTGYSSLSYLRSFPFDKIKIDGSFIRDLSEKEDAKAIIKAVAGLGSSLGMETTAEGVETEAQLEKVVSDGYTQIQGFLYSKPRNASEITEEYFSVYQKALSA